jgi:hypothetical protein
MLTVSEGVMGGQRSGQQQQQLCVQVLRGQVVDLALRVAVALDVEPPADAVLPHPAQRVASLVS